MSNILYTNFACFNCCMGGSKGGRGPRPLGKSHVAKGFLRNTDTDHLGPIAARGSFVRPSVKYVDE